MLLLLALALAAFLAPAGQAKTAGSAGAKPAQETGGGKNNGEPEHVKVAISCTGVTWEYTNFPEEGTTTITESVKIDGVKQKEPTVFTFSGATGENTTTFAAPPGSYIIDAQGSWKNPPGSEKQFGHFDIHARVDCAPAPALTIEKLQAIANSGEEPTTEMLKGGQVGDTVDYKLVVSNTGNVPLKLENFEDPHCDAGTLVPIEHTTGEPDGTELAAGADATYACTHLLDEADQMAGSYSNIAEVTGIPPEGDGPPVTKESNIVVVEVLPTPPIVLPAFSIEKLQKVAGGGGSYTTAQLSASIGQTVEYEIVVTNTGNVPLNLSDFIDTHCASGTLSGGPVDGALPTGDKVAYSCTRPLPEAGSYSNVAEVTGTPPAGDGSPIAHASNTVLVEVPAATPNNSQTTNGNGSSSGLPSGVPGSSQGGVLAFKASVPTLNGPQGCVRSRFHVSIKSAGVASVTFYLDGHKLKTLTAKNAHKGLLTIEINPAKLKVGAHKLVAKITMAATASKKATVAKRTVTILRCHGAAVTPKFTG